jgi:hypothetical protein
MAVVNGYCTLSEYKVFVVSRGQTATTDANDDAVIEDIIEGASRLIDTHTGVTFYGRSGTHYYNTPSGNTLQIDDDDLLSITTLTNGDGSVISASNYKLLPLNKSPKYEIYLEPGSNLSWKTDSSGDSVGVISINGTWGFSATAPHDVRQACLIIALSEYMRRFGENVTATATVTGAGVVLTPQGMPRNAADLLQSYKKLL